MSKKLISTARIIAATYRAKKDGTIPLYLRVINRGDKREYGLKIYVTESEYNFKTNKFKKSPDKNIKLNAIEEKAAKALEEIEHFSFHAFEEKFFGENLQDCTVSEYLDTIVKENYKNGKRGNGDIYNDTRTSLIGFKGSNLRFTDITPIFLKEFGEHLKKTCGTTTISMYMRTLRAAFNRAIENNIIPLALYPFSNNHGKGFGKKGYAIKNKKAKSKFALSKEEILSILDYPTNPNTRLRNSQNYFAFSFLARGINFKDLCLLTKKNIINDRVNYIRSKTEDTNKEEKEISIKISERMAVILEQYSDNDPFIFPVLEPNLPDKTAKSRMKGALKKINKDIRQIAEELKITRSEEIVFYVARHTYASILNDNNVQLSDISESLGHSSIKTTENYIHSLNTRLDENDNYLV